MWLTPINNYGETFYVDSDNVDDMSKWIKFGHVFLQGALADYSVILISSKQSKVAK